MQDSMAAEVDKMNLKTGVFILVVSYVYADYWLWMLHCFLGIHLKMCFLVYMYSVCV